MEERSATASSSPAPQKAAAKTVAAIDIGANALRMVVAQVTPTGEIEVLERLQRAVRLGQDTFRVGRLGGQSMRAAVAVLRDYCAGPAAVSRRADPRRRHQRRPRGQQRRHASGPHVHGHRRERRGDRHVGGEPADRLGGLRRDGGVSRHEPGRHADRRRRRRQHAVDPAARRQDRHVAQSPPGIGPAAGDAGHQRGGSEALRRAVSPADRQGSVFDGPVPLAGRHRVVRRRGGRCPIRRPARRRTDRRGQRASRSAARRSTTW